MVVHAFSNSLEAVAGTPLFYQRVALEQAGELKPKMQRQCVEIKISELIN